MVKIASSFLSVDTDVTLVVSSLAGIAASDVVFVITSLPFDMISTGSISAGSLATVIVSGNGLSSIQSLLIARWTG